MANSFAERVKNIEARINQLKTAGLSSSSSVSTISKTIILSVKIVGSTYSTQSENSYRITVNWKNSAGLCSAYIKSPTNLNNRRYVLERITDSSHKCQFGFSIFDGSNQDDATISAGGSIPAFNVEIEVVATSDFDLTYTTRRLD